MPQPQSEPFDTRHLDLLDLLRYSDQGPQAQLLSESPSVRLVGFALRAGQEIKEHRSPSQLLVQVIDGNLTFTVSGQEFRLHAGAVLQVGAGILHHLHATADTRMLLVMTPSPASLHAEGREQS